MADPPAVRAELQIKSLDDGSLEIKFAHEGKEIAVAICSPEEVSGLVAHLLKAAHAAFVTAEKTPDASLGKIKFPGPIPVTQWAFGHTESQGQRAVIVQVGDAVLGFAVPEDKVRGLGRVLISSAWKIQSSAGLRDLLWSLLKEFADDLRGWGALFKARFNASARRLASSFSSRISGRSLRLVRTVSVLPGANIPDYDPVGKCIYCGSEVYSEKPGVRRHPLGAEHIIAEGLDGKLELPEASCQKCEDITGRVIEGDILLRTLKFLRMHLKIRGKAKSSRPKTLPMQVHEGGQERTIQMPIDDYPVILNMPAFGVPGVFVGGPGGNQRIAGFRLVILHYDEKKLRKEYGITSFSSPSWDTHMLYRMLAKIGHSFATAELGQKNFKPLLVDLILNGNPDLFNHIGGEPDLDRDPKSSALHELGLGYQRANGRDYVVAKVRLFAKHSGPIYYVVIGESLEGRIAKFRRTFSRGFLRSGSSKFTLGFVKLFP